MDQEQFRVLPLRHYIASLKRNSIEIYYPNAIKISELLYSVLLSIKDEHLTHNLAKFY